jgi:hypothetical protein
VRETPHHPTSIGELPRLIAQLPEDERARVETLFAVTKDVGEMVVPPPLAAWMSQHFGPLDQAQRQQVVRVTNRWTHEGASFNPLRALRPDAGMSAAAEQRVALHERIGQARGDDFCRVLDRTPADIFGRVTGRYSRSAANLARADGWHGVVVFDEHDPLAIGPEQLADGLMVVREWAARAHALRVESSHLFVLWNCLWRAGASQVHAHLQMLLSRQMPQAAVERWRAAVQAYRAATGRPYFADALEAHRALGLVVMDGRTSAYASLTPIKEREVVLLAPGPTWSAPRGDPASDDAFVGFARDIARTVEGLRQLGVTAFNLAVFGPPLASGGPAWEDFPAMARLVDRGDPLSATADMAALELFGSSVVAHDPFVVARALRASL